MPWWGGRGIRVPAAYGYIAASLEGWLTAAEFAHLLERQGLLVESLRTDLGGGIAIHVASKPPVRASGAHDRR